MKYGDPMTRIPQSEDYGTDKVMTAKPPELEVIVKILAAQNDELVYTITEIEEKLNRIHLEQSGNKVPPNPSPDSKENTTYVDYMYKQLKITETQNGRLRGILSRLNQII